MEELRVIKVLGIDASTQNIGWAVVGYHRGILLKSGVISMSSKLSFYQRLKYAPWLLRREIDALDYSDIKVIAIEHSFFTNNPEVGKKISMMIGACLSALMHLTEVVYEVSPTEIKKRFAGRGKADKSEIIAEVKRRYSIDHELKDDEADAIAIAVMFAELHKADYFKQKAAVKKEKRAIKAKKTAVKKAVKTGKPVVGELKL